MPYSGSGGTWLTGCCPWSKRKSKVVWNQCLDELVKAFSTGLPPENVDSSSALVRAARAAFLPVFCPSAVRKWNFLLNQCLGRLTQRFSTGLLPKNVDILTMGWDKCRDHAGGNAAAQRLRASLAD
ncbi:hypothetical protein EJD96_15580 [Herbaspirillum seropedicae]|uniref:hypothetical protein n=1 Tax=Herbaspirillum seropedicae TaxID=964 RepID=UPI0011233E19|nr:hypothetical protein [Herbaspirillum seropedicae]QDD65477.1 hypothetical protein EJD96_15580 [Herbaspirillum seropedicae]